MTNIGHFRAASKLLEGKTDIPVRLWMAPPTKMDAKELSDEGHYGVLGRAGARMEMDRLRHCVWVTKHKYTRVRPSCPTSHP